MMTASPTALLQSVVVQMPAYVRGFVPSAVGFRAVRSAGTGDADDRGRSRRDANRLPEDAGRGRADDHRIGAA